MSSDMRTLRIYSKQGIETKCRGPEQETAALRIEAIVGNKLYFEDELRAFASTIARVYAMDAKLDVVHDIVETGSFKMMDRALFQVMSMASQIECMNRNVSPDSVDIVEIDGHVFTQPNGAATSYILDRFLECYKDNTEAVAMILEFRKNHRTYFAINGEMKV